MRRTLLLLASLAFAAPAAAQQTDPTLARVDTLIAATRLTEARNTLDRWLASSAGRDRESDAAPHALLLRARLMSSADSALPVYLELALNHPASRFAPEALLRLGQGYLAFGENDRADAYLLRLVRDYPNFDQRPAALLWRARAQRARRHDADACRTLAQALESAGATSLRPVVEQELTRCNQPRTDDAAPQRAPAAERSEPRATSSTGRFAVQIGAFRDHAAAHALARRLRARDIDARVVRIGDGSLAHVRAGHFATSADAASLLRQVRAIVPDAVIASDVARESPIER